MTSDGSLVMSEELSDNSGEKENLLFLIGAFCRLLSLEIEYPGGEKQYFLHLLFFAFHRGQKAIEAARDIYGEGVLGESTGRNGLQISKMAFLMSTTRPAAEELMNSTKRASKSKHFGRRTVTKQVVNLSKKKMKYDCKTILNHLYLITFTERLGGCVPHKLNENNKENRFQIVSQHLAHHRSTRGHKQRFLYRIVKVDEKLCLYINMRHRKVWVDAGVKSKQRVNPDILQRRP
ncbi:HTH_48 domain-containing protein [Trichonephila clavata]|uniref:HTH_48 domain-containing protein n=1 Tax=Trichonephila clavata TaxID=2740835 RepID=A0A8X6L794_TRICU|nr:HTH_48 domain-containing protein [Trichonephila clavata]